MKVTVVGLGKIGLPLAVQYAMKGQTVFGVDVNQNTVNLINAGLEPFPEESDLQKYLSLVITEGKLLASTDTAQCVSNSDVVVVVVPLFVNENGEPDFRALDSATNEIARGIKKGTLVAFETTLPIGTTRDRFTTLIEDGAGLRVGKDFFVVFSPERVLTGRIFEDLKKYPKILGGVTRSCADAGLNFYNQVLDFDPRDDLERSNGVWVLSNAESAEFVKLAETTYRDVNIGLANQFAIHAEKMNVNIYEVIDAANSQSYSKIHQPGVAVGGHCIPVYPNFYLKTDPDAEIVRQARRTNESMPQVLIDSLERYFLSLSNRNFLILGLSYREGVKETYASGAFALRDTLKKYEGKVFIYDRLYSKEEVEGYGFLQWEGAKDEIHGIIIQNADTHYLDFLESNGLNEKPIFDGRRLFREYHKMNVVYQLGNPIIT